MTSARRPRILWGVILLAALAAVVARAGGPAGGPVEEGVAAVEAAFQERRSGVWVEAGGVVERLLTDDLEGSRHQRFIVRLAGDRTVLVTHNVDLAPRVTALEPGDPVRFRGRYEWNPQGGVVHWTHHDPDGRIPGGWLDAGGRRFR